MQELTEFNIEKTTAEKYKIIDEFIFDQIKLICSQYNPYNMSNLGASLEDLVYMFEEQPRVSNFIGGCNDIRNTTHENMFMIMFPSLDKQVTFGTGKNGYTKFGTKKYIADFVDEKEKVIFEIDGIEHNKEKNKIKDIWRDFFFENLGYKTVRVPNSIVEEIFKKWINEQNVSGKIAILNRAIKMYGGKNYYGYK